MLGWWYSFRKRLLSAKRQQHRCKGAWLPSSLQVLGRSDLISEGQGLQGSACQLATLPG